VILYSHTITPRLQYIIDFISNEIPDANIQCTDNIQQFRQFSGPRFNYSTERLTTNELWLQPHHLLFEKGIRPHNIECFEKGNKKFFFKTEGDFHFDIFASAFYLLSRYEEYLPHKKDMYGRYAYENSLAYKENFLHLPVVNLWLNDFKKLLKEKYPQLNIQSTFTKARLNDSVGQASVDKSASGGPRRFKIIPTYDIDIAYSYKHKGWERSIFGIFKSMSTRQWDMLKERWNVLEGKQKDPFDAYDWIDEVNEKYHLDPYYFFIVADKNGKYDKNISPQNEEMQSLIRRHAARYKIGIHPSWRSGDRPELVKKEKQTLEKITNNKITVSRQHYIRFKLPKTFRQLIDAGIQSDFSMGYGSINGFRASVASPFLWYDLEKEQRTELSLYPFCYMDANSFFEQKLTPREALEELRNYSSIIKSVDGLMITIWHNTFLGTDKMFEGWRGVYESWIRETL
jgi:hypothetical protein